MSTNQAEEKLIKFFQGFKPYKYKKGEVIIRPDDTPLNIYFVEEGYVRVYKITDWGDIKVQIIYKQGEIFPINWVFTDTISNEFFEAMTNLVLYKVPKGEFLEFMKKNTEELLQVANRMMDVLTVSRERTDNLLFTDAYSRLISRLLHLARRFGNKTSGMITILAPLNQKDIAFSIGMTRETASRQLSKLERKRLITYKNHLIVVKNLEKLQEELTHSHERKKL